MNRARWSSRLAEGTSRIIVMVLFVAGIAAAGAAWADCRVSGLVGGTLTYGVSPGSVSPSSYSFLVWNDGATAMLVAPVCDLSAIWIEPAGPAVIAAGASLQFTVGYTPTGCAAGDVWGELDLGADCAVIPVHVLGDWYYEGALSTNELQFNVAAPGGSDQQSFFVLNQACGDAGLEVRFSTGGMWHPEFEVTPTSFIFGTEIVVTYRPLDSGPDVVDLRVDVDMTTSGGHFVTSHTVRLDAQGPYDGPTWYVAPGGDDAHSGTASRPFATIGRAILAADTGDEVVLADGIYTGPGNRDLSFGGRNLFLHSASDDPEACVIDCQGGPGAGHFAFWFHDEEDTTTVIRGITVTGAFVEPPAFAAIMMGETVGSPIPGYGPAAVKLTNLKVAGNACAGIGVDGEDSGLLMDRCVVVDNEGDGLALKTAPAPGTGFAIGISSCTVAHNGGSGLVVDLAGAGELELAGTLIVGNGEYSVDAAEDYGERLRFNCVNSFGNGGGDWFGSFADQLDVDGNNDGDPRFCDPAAGDFSLSGDSPCAPGFHPDGADCGLIGALGVGCDARIVPCADIQEYDPGTGAIASRLVGEYFNVEGVVYLQPAAFNPISGGYLQDASGGINFWSAPTATNLHEGDRVRLQGPLWYAAGELYIGTFTYAKLDSGLVCVPVSGSITELLSDFDHVGSFVKVVGAVTSVGAGSVWISDGNHEIEVLLTASVGLDPDAYELGRILTVQGACTIIDGVMNVKPRRSADILADGMSAAPAPVASALVLHPATPNPFNPATTIRFELGNTGLVRLSVFDLAGRLVRTLVDGILPPGVHDAVWTGRDASGREVGSGSYLARLEFGGMVEVVRLGLVR